MTKTRVITKLTILLALAGAGLFLTAPSSPATPVAPVAPVQAPCVPAPDYPCPPPPGPAFQLDLTLSANTGPRGLITRAQVCGFSGPGVPFQVFFADVHIISGTSGDGPTPAQRCSAEQTFSNEASPTGGALATQLAASGVQLVSSAQQAGFPLTYKVPSLALAEHPVCASAPGHNSDCEQFRIIGDEGTSNDSLARTGIAVGLLLALALALIVVGRTVVASAKRRRGDREGSDTEDREPANLG